MHNIIIFKLGKIFTVLLHGIFLLQYDSSNNQLKLLDYYCFADGKLCNIQYYILFLVDSNKLKFH